MWFWQKKEVKEDVSATLHQRLSSLESRFNQVESMIINMSMTMDTFRDKVLRKIQKKHEEQQEIPIMPKAGMPYKRGGLNG